MLLGDLYIESCNYEKAEEIYYSVLTFTKEDQSAN